MSSRESGSTTVVMAAICALITVLSVAVAAVATLYAARAQAENAADAAALAAAVATYPPSSHEDPVAAARRLLVANGASLVSCDCSVDTGLDPRTVTVTASVHADVPLLGTLAVRGSSRAEFDPASWLGVGAG